MGNAMTIHRRDLDKGLIDFSGIATEKRLPPVHPGRILRNEFLKPLALTAYRLAKELRIPANRVTAIVAGRRSLTADTALRLGRYFNTSAEFWLGLQEAYDLDIARRAMKKVLPAIKPHVLHAAE